MFKRKREPVVRKREPVVVHMSPPSVRVSLEELEYAIKIWREFDEHVADRIEPYRVRVWVIRDALEEIVEVMAGQIARLVADRSAPILEIPPCT